MIKKTWSSCGTPCGVAPSPARAPDEIPRAIAPTTEPAVFKNILPPIYPLSWYLGTHDRFMTDLERSTLAPYSLMRSIRPMRRQFRTKLGEAIDSVEFVRRALEYTKPTVGKA